MDMNIRRRSTLWFACVFGIRLIPLLFIASKWGSFRQLPRQLPRRYRLQASCAALFTHCLRTWNNTARHDLVLTNG
jgi:hypothetical protein